MAQLDSSAILFYAGAMALAGLILIKTGRWPARVAGPPRCRKCEYLVVNISSERCPECGALLAGKGTVRGVRPKHTGVWVSGVIVLLFSLGWGGPHLYRDVEWYRIKPTWWVMKDLEGGGTRLAERAWGELRRRQAKGSLSREAEGRMVDAVLAGKVPAPRFPNTTDLLKFLWEQYEAGKLKPQQVDPFFSEASRTTWKVRPVVLVGQDVPCNGGGLLYLPKDWVMRFEMENDRRMGAYGALGDGQGYYYDPGGAIRASAKQTPGEHELEIRCNVAFYRGKGSMNDYEAVEKLKPVWEGKQLHRLKVKVLEAPGAEYMTGVDAPELAQQIKASLKVDGLSYRPGEDYVNFHVSVDRPPMNLAFEVLARIDGKEHRIGEVTFPGTATHAGYGGGGDWPQGARPKKVDLIFRGSEEVAGKTLDMFDVWKGEIVVEGVEVREFGN